MINAKEAKRITESSRNAVLEFLATKVEPKVTAAARAGVHRVCIDTGSAPKGQLPDPTECQKLVIQELNVLEYGVIFGFYGKAYVPKGLQDDNFNGPEYMNYGIMINW